MPHCQGVNSKILYHLFSHSPKTIHQGPSTIISPRYDKVINFDSLIRLPNPEVQNS